MEVANLNSISSLLNSGIDGATDFYYILFFFFKSSLASKHNGDLRVSEYCLNRLMEKSCTIVGFFLCTVIFAVLDLHLN